MRRNFRFFFSLSRSLSRYNRLKDSEQAATSKKYGIYVIIVAIVAIAWSFLIPLTFKLFGAGSVFGTIAAVFTGILGVGGLLSFLFWMIVYLIYQFKLNKSAIRFVALIVFLLAVAAIVFVGIYFTGKF